MNWKEILQQQNLELSKELLERQGRINELTAEVRQLREQVANPPMLYRADAAGNLALVEKALDPDSESIIVHEVRRLRQQRDQVLALCEKAQIGVTQHCWCPEGDDGALKHSPYCKGPQSYWDLDPDAIRAVYASSAQPSNLEAR